MHKVGIRREDKDAWEARVPLVPDDVKDLVAKGDATICVQPSALRVFADDAFASAGAQITEDLGDCDIVLAVKEIPEDRFLPGKTYVFFSHTIKGQPYNMDMLRRMMALGCQLLDYERIVDERNVRLISFSRFAGLAGVTDTLWALGRRLEWEGLSPNPFAGLRQTHQYSDIDAMLRDLAQCGQRLKAEGVPEALRPLVIGVTGYGRVSRGAQEALDALDPVAVAPGDLEGLVTDPPPDRRVHKVVFREEDTVESKEAGKSFDFADFCAHPESYRGTFARFLPWLSVIINAVYWEERYPRLVTRADLRELWARGGRPRLSAIGDVTCDICGSVECTVKDTHVDEPVYVYDPVDDCARDGVEGRGVLMMAVGNLPCELSRDASEAFSHVLATFMPALAAADFTAPFEQLVLPDELKRALILHHGELTPDYEYLRSFL